MNLSKCVWLILNMAKGQKKQVEEPKPKERHTLLKWLSKKKEETVDDAALQKDQSPTQSKPVKARAKRIKKIVPDVVEEDKNPRKKKGSKVDQKDLAQNASDIPQQNKPSGNKLKSKAPRVQLQPRKPETGIEATEKVKKVVKKRIMKPKKKKEDNPTTGMQNAGGESRHHSHAANPLRPQSTVSRYSFLLIPQELSNVEYIFDKSKPDEMRRFLKHIPTLAAEVDPQDYEEYPEEIKEKPKPVPISGEGLKKYQVPIKVCTCCNFFGKRHLCSHNLCEKPCPIEHRKSKIRHRYFERYKNKVRNHAEEEGEEEEVPGEQQ